MCIRDRYSLIKNYKNYSFSIRLLIKAGKEVINKFSQIQGMVNDPPLQSQQNLLLVRSQAQHCLHLVTLFNLFLFF